VGFTEKKDEKQNYNENVMLYVNVEFFEREIVVGNLFEKFLSRL
jgi:hypothetical protein